MDVALIVIIIISAMAASLYYASWMGERPKIEPYDGPETTPGTQEHTQQSIVKFARMINPFRNLWYDLRLYGGLAVIFGITYFLVKLIVK